MQKLSKKQQEAIDLLKQHIAEKGYSPTVRELAEMLGHKSSSTTHAVMKKLQEKGYIKNVGVRAIEILAPDENLHSELEFMADELAKLVSNYNFPKEVLKDTFQRLFFCTDPNYIQQQVQYLQKLVDADIVAKK